MSFKSYILFNTQPRRLWRSAGAK